MADDEDYDAGDMDDGDYNDDDEQLEDMEQEGDGGDDEPNIQLLEVSPDDRFVVSYIYFA